MSVQISIVIPSFNRRDLLEQCLHSLETQTLAPDKFEVIVVDDGSTDYTAEWLAAGQKRASAMLSSR